MKKKVCRHQVSWAHHSIYTFWRRSTFFCSLFMLDVPNQPQTTSQPWAWKGTLVSTLTMVRYAYQHKPLRSQITGVDNHPRSNTWPGYCTICTVHSGNTSASGPAISGPYYTSLPLVNALLLTEGPLTWSVVGEFMFSQLGLFLSYLQSWGICHPLII